MPVRPSHAPLYAPSRTDGISYNGGVCRRVGALEACLADAYGVSGDRDPAGHLSTSPAPYTPGGVLITMKPLTGW